MTAQPTGLSPIGQEADVVVGDLSASYDRRSDVLYLTTAPGVPAVSAHGPLGMVFRRNIDTKKPIGVTIIDFAELAKFQEQMIDEITVHLGIDRETVSEVVAKFMPLTTSTAGR